MRTKVVLACGLLCYLGVACSDEVGLGGDEGGEAGISGNSGAPAAGTGGTAGSAAGGTGGKEPNTCPPSEVHAGATPGILCDEAGQTCADSETFCRCVEMEAGPEIAEVWSCVPTGPACPASPPNNGDVCLSDTSDECSYRVEDGRWDCTCEDGVFDCQLNNCHLQVLNGSECDTPGQECAYFRPKYPISETPAGNVPCVCREDGFWSCNDGCPQEFPGEGSACDPSVAADCNFRTDEGALYCGCGSEPPQWNCVNAGP